MKDRLPPAQLKVLQNMIAGRHPTFGFMGGRSTAGGLTGTFAALYRKGFLARGEVTDTGRAAVAKAEGRS